MLIERAGDEFFSSPRRPANQDGRLCRGNPANFLVNCLHCAAPADYGRTIRVGFAQVHGLGHELAARHSRSDEFQQFVCFKRFDQVITRTQLRGLNGCFGCSVGRHQNDRLLRLCCLELLDHFESTQARHAQVGDNNMIIIS